MTIRLPLVLASADLISLAAGVAVMNAAALPAVLGFLLVLEATVLPTSQRMRGWYKIAAGRCAWPSGASACT